MSNGPFIVLEGLDGAGTTTQAALLKSWFENFDGRRVYLTREPTNGPVGSLLQLALRRRIDMDARTMALLFAADRMDHIVSEIEEKLARNVTVICDRYYLSSFAYQLLDAPDDLPWLEQLNAKALPPDLTILVDVPAEICMDRIQRTRWHKELFEELDGLRSVRTNYLTLARGPRSQQERIVIVDGNRSPEAVHEEIYGIVREQWGL